MIRHDVAVAVVLVASAWTVAADDSPHQKAPTAVDAREVQATVLAHLINKGAAEAGIVACVWATPPGGDPEGTRAPEAGTNFRTPTPELLEGVRHLVTADVLEGPACEGGIKGVSERGTGRAARWFYVDEPAVKGDRANVAGGYYCGGRCDGTYRFTLTRRRTGWSTVDETLLSIS